MASTVTFASELSASEIPDDSSIVIVGKKDEIINEFKKGSWVKTLLTSTSGSTSSEPKQKRARTTKDESSTEDCGVLTLVAETLSPSEDFGASSQVWLRSSSGAMKSVWVCALPAACSRHNAPSLPHAITSFLRDHGGGGHKNVVVGLVLSSADHVMAAGCAVTRAFSLYHGKSSEAPKGSTVVTFNKPVAQETVLRLGDVSHGIRLAQRLVDAPCSEVHTDAMVAEASAVAAELGIKPVIIKGEELNKRGFGGLWGVGKAAVHLPALVVLSHGGTSGGVAFVGKGIVYDTGGLSIKGSAFMPGMKADMGGAAAILGAFRAAVLERKRCSPAEQQQQQPIHALLCCAENSVSDRATRPDDILTLYSGRTVEVNNTDAEGRLVLGDGVAYAVKHLQPRVIADVATLTGASLISTGRNHAAICCSDEETEAAVVAAGRVSGDLTHAMPYCPEFYRNEFKSAVADMKNSVRDRSNAQVSCAATFIHNHLGEHLSSSSSSSSSKSSSSSSSSQSRNIWLHVDMAGVAVHKGSERATGYGVALLTQLLRGGAL